MVTIEQATSAATSGDPSRTEDVSATTLSTRTPAEQIADAIDPSYLQRYQKGERK